MDPRMQAKIEDWMGFPLRAFPPAGIRLLESPVRQEAPEKRIMALRLAGQAGVLVTGTARALTAIESAVAAMDASELLSPLGMFEIRRALALPDTDPVFHGLTYTVCQPDDLHPPAMLHPARPLRRKDIPPAELEMRMKERRCPDDQDWIWSYGCFDGEQMISHAVLMWYGPQYMVIGVETDEAFRRQGYASSVVYAVTQYALQLGAIVAYGAATDNVASLRTARTLGFRFSYEILLA